MIFSSNNRLTSLLVPALLLGLTAYAAPLARQLPSFLLEQLSALPYLVLIGAMTLGAIYGKQRSVMISLVIGICYLASSSVMSGELLLNEADTRAKLSALALITAVSILVIASFQDRRLLSSKGIATIGMIILLMAGFTWGFSQFPEIIGLLLLADIFPLQWQYNGYLSQPIALLYLMLGGVLFSLWLKKNNVFEAAFVGSLVAVALAVHTGMSNPEGVLYLSVAGMLQALAIIQNSYVIAYIDELTELPGRRALNEELGRLRGKYSIAMLDIDHFKQFNDTYGHDIGDQVLRMVASKLSKVGGGGKAFRYGGEEFAVVFANRTLKDVFPHLSNLRESIDDTRMVLRNRNRPKKKPDPMPEIKGPSQTVHVTISIGVAEKNQELQTTDQVIKAADEALYRSKEKGRNRISQHGMNFGLPAAQEDNEPKPSRLGI